MASIKSYYLVLSVAFSLVIVTIASESLTPHSKVIQTENGPIQGVLKQARGGVNYVAYLGLRYANPATRFEVM